MNDTHVTLQQLKSRMAEFVHEREWEQFHTAKNVSADIAVEAAELVEHFLWCKESEIDQILEKNREAIEDEVSDILLALCAFANACKIDVAHAFERKMKKNKAKYPIEKAKGCNKKYTEL